MTLVAGVDFGTASVRVSIAEAGSEVIARAVAAYPTRTDPRDPHLFTQVIADHFSALERAFATAIASSGRDGRQIASLAVATTGSTVCFVDDALRPIDDCYLWCDHRATAEAAQITAAARRVGLPAIDYCGGTYSPEWGFSKLLHWLRHNPARRSDLGTAIEHCDLVVATLCGVTALHDLPRSICAMGHKWLWQARHGGLPPEEFLASVDPLLAGMRARLAGRYATSDMIAGALSSHWAERLGLRAGIPIPVGALDAHWDAIGAGCQPGDVVNVIGTSSCIMALGPLGMAPITGIPGVVDGSIDPDHAGIEAGIAAVGALFEAIARRADTNVADLLARCTDHVVGGTGLVRLPWDNGDRSILADASLRGVMLGWRLDHDVADELFAAVEGTAFQTRIVIDHLAAHGAPVSRIINTGGLARQSSAVNLTYADALARPVLVPRGDMTGRGAAQFALRAVRAAPLRPLEYGRYEPRDRHRDQVEAAYHHFRQCYFDLPRLLAASVA